MQVAQKLFEGKEINNKYIGLITYHRTDSTRVAISFLDELKIFLKRYPQEEININNLSTASEKELNVQDAHECIRPTDITIIPNDIKNSLSKDEFNLYSLIYYNFIASCFNPPTWIKHTCLFNYNNQQQNNLKDKLNFSYNYFTNKTKGYLHELECSKISIQYNLKAINTDLLNLSINLKTKQLTGPKPISEVNLIEELEKNNIGRPSTYATIIPKIIEKKYIYKLDNLIHMTKLGIFVNENMKNFFPDLINLVFTSELEQKLENIVQNNLEYKNILLDLKNLIEKNIIVYKEYIKNLKKNCSEGNFKCIFCSNKLIIFFGRFSTYGQCQLNHKYSINIYDLKENEIVPFKINNESINLANNCKECKTGSLYIILNIKNENIKLFCINCKNNTIQLKKNINRIEFKDLIELQNNYICPFVF
jgi:DNA topoisomerase-1